LDTPVGFRSPLGRKATDEKTVFTPQVSVPVSVYDQRVNIALITSEYPATDGTVGGLGTYTANIAQLLRNEGHLPVILALADRPMVSNGDGLPVIDVIRRRPSAILGNTRFFWRYEIPIRRYLDSRRLLRALESLDQRHKIDVVQMTNCHSPGLAIAGSKRWPTVTRFSNLEWLWREANGGRIDASQRMLDKLDARQALASTITCAPSLFLADHARSSLGLSPRLVRTPPPTRAPYPTEPLRREKNRIAFVGTCNRIKGFDLFLEAADDLLGRDLPVRFEIAGRLLEPSPLRDHLEKIRSRQSSRINVRGPVNREAVNDILDRTGCLVIPSRVDNYPNICLEAQARGCPVIASADSSLDEMVTEGRDGFLFENGSADSLVAALRRFLDLSKRSLLRMSEAARDTDEHRRSDNPVSHLVSLYEEAQELFEASVSST
jgi:glycosyltransferase involved in cell wall biosynthesis